MPTSVDGTTRQLVIAHRTCPRHAPENSLEGVRRAAELGADLVEVDVRRTRDGIPVLCHDPLLWRTARRPWPVWAVASPRLRSVRLRHGGERVPFLADLLRDLPPDLGVAIDIKHASAAAATLAEVHRHGVADRVLLWSQKSRAVRYLARSAPGTEVALLRDTRDDRTDRRMLDDAERWGATAVSVHQSRVTQELVDEAHRRGLRVHAWFQDPDTQRRLLPFVDGVVTDWVEDAVLAARRA